MVSANLCLNFKLLLQDGAHADQDGFQQPTGHWHNPAALHYPHHCLSPTALPLLLAQLHAAGAHCVIHHTGRPGVRAAAPQEQFK